MDILEQDALAISSALELGSLSSVDLMQATLDRINATNGAVNAIVSLRDAAELMAEAAEADRAPRKGWLHGIPIAIKDLANVKGLPTTMGSPMFADLIAPEDEIMVARIRAAGAIIIGKTNTPEFGLGSHTFNPVFGATGNPYDTHRSAGGSSGGAAAALATRMLCIADGSDMMGSLRNPAGWNNVYGMRPGWGTVISEPEANIFRGMLATSGPMARSPRDLAALLETMTGNPHLQGMAELPTEGIRLGWLGDWGGAYPFEEGILEISDAALGQLEEAGFGVDAVPAPHPAEEIWKSWITLRSFCVAAGLEPLYNDPAKRQHLKPAAQWEASRGLTMGTPAVIRGAAQRSEWFSRAMQLFETYDFLLLPSAQVWPFDVSLVNPAEIAGRKMDTYHRWMEVVVPAGLLGLPVVNLPIGFGDNGLPAGLQLIGPPGSDTRLLAVAEKWHQSTLWPQTRPPAI